jgi:GT2 family glycosyltransferase
MSEAPGSAEPSIAVLIVNYNSGGMLGRSLEALSKQTRRDFRVVVVDNASGDDSARSIEGRYPNLILVPAGGNLGFAAGNNLALRHAGAARWIVLLNPDAFPEPDWLARLVEAAEARPEYGFFGCRMLLADTPQFLDGTGDVYHVSGASWRRDHGAAVERGTNEPGEIFAPCAAAAMYARPALDEVGGFDERYFCYHEDVDLAFRLRLRGHRCWYVPQAVVHHVSSGIVGRRSEFAIYYGQRNLVWTFVKDMPGLLFWLLLPLHVAMNVASVAVWAARGELGVILRAKRDALAGLPAVLRQRRVVQAARKAGIGSLLGLMAWSLSRR